MQKQNVGDAMKEFTLANLAQVTKGRIIIPEGWKNQEEELLRAEARGAVIDSRKIEDGYVFFALKGERVDGHSFIPQVMDQGALFAVCEHIPEEMAGPCLLVEDCRKALKDCAAFYRDQLSVKVVGITGSVGKTSTKEFIASVLSQKYRIWKTEKNYNNEIGLPLTIFQIREEHEAAVLEMGINHFGEMHRMSFMAKPDCCVLTNIGSCHLEFLGTRDGILKAKSEIFDFMQEDGVVCMNGDDDKLSGIREVHGKPPYTFGLGEANDFYATDIVNRGLFGSRAVIHGDGKSFLADIPLPGEHMVYNALAAALVGTWMGLTKDQIAAGIRSVEPLSGRSHILTLNGITVIDDCYNANPDSMQAALELLATGLTRKVAILGDMFELGGKEKELHAQVGAYAVDCADCVICVGGLSRNMYEKAMQVNEGGRTELHYFETRDQLLQELDGLVGAEDTILVKASHGMAFDKIVERLIGKES